jgi:uncharacterized Zn finger protein (UPF0148 family)
MSLETLKNIIEFNRAQPDGEDIENNECPYDAWPLKENERGYKSCPICGRIYLGNRQVL